MFSTAHVVIKEWGYIFSPDFACYFIPTGNQVRDRLDMNCLGSFCGDQRGVIQEKGCIKLIFEVSLTLSSLNSVEIT